MCRLSSVSLQSTTLREPDRSLPNSYNPRFGGGLFVGGLLTGYDEYNTYTLALTP
jgi:hypothetical protein